MALYPGTVYRPFHPILLQSIGNPFILRCLDGTLVDGKNNGLSGIVFRSCRNRDLAARGGPTCDLTWMRPGEDMANPLNVGQIVNNGGVRDANVSYHEIELSSDNFDPLCLRFLPNVRYDSDSSTIRIVPLIALRDINQGEEVLSSYFSLVNKTSHSDVY